MAETFQCCGQTFTCESGGFCAEWDDGTCSSACTSGSDLFEEAIDTPIAQGGRGLQRLTVKHMRLGALRQILGGAVSDVARDQQFVDFVFENTTVAAVLASLER